MYRRPTQDPLPLNAIGASGDCIEMHSGGGGLVGGDGSVGGLGGPGGGGGETGSGRGGGITGGLAGGGGGEGGGGGWAGGAGGEGGAEGGEGGLGGEGGEGLKSCSREKRWCGLEASNRCLLGRTNSSSSALTPNHSPRPFHIASQGVVGMSRPRPMLSGLASLSARVDGYAPRICPPRTSPPMTTWLPPQAWSVPRPLDVSVRPKSESVAMATCPGDKLHFSHFVHTRIVHALHARHTMYHRHVSQSP